MDGSVPQLQIKLRGMVNNAAKAIDGISFEPHVTLHSFTGKVHPALLCERFALDELFLFNAERVSMQMTCRLPERWHSTDQ